MKKNVIPILILAFSVIFVSCSTESVEVGDLTLKNKSEKALVCYPKSNLKTRAYSIDNSWETWNKVKLASGDSVYTPWNEKLTSGTIPYDIRTDIKYEKGWDLIAHTLNGYGDRGMNYMVFHNRYTGILKVFYYVEVSQAALQNTAMWKLHFETPQSCLAFSGPYASASTQKNVKDIYLGNITNDDSKGYTLGWNCFQTELAYDPDYKDGKIQIIPSSMTTSQIHLYGNIDTKTEGLIISTTNTNALSGGINTTANFAGKKAEEWVGNALKNNKLFKKVSSLLVSGAGSIVSSGVSSLLGSFVGGFDKSQQTTQSVQLRTSGTIKLDGELRTIQSGIIMPLDLSLSPNDVGHLGTWCLTKEPFLLMYPYANQTGKVLESPYFHEYSLSIPNPAACQGLVEMNPDLKDNIESYSINCNLYENDTLYVNDAFKNGNICQGWSNNHGELLYNHTYFPQYPYVTYISLKNKNGDVLENYTGSEGYETFIPNAPDGTRGAIPDFNAVSSYVVVLTVTIKTKQGDTVVSSHTFIPYLKWNYDSFSDGMYLNDYPTVPIDDY